MDFRIADTFTDSLAKITGDEQKAVKTTAFDLQMNPAHPGMQFHKLDKAKGLEFRGVVVMACDDEVIPQQERIESVSDESELEEGIPDGTPPPLRGLRKGAR
jgi:superfamily I DNA/RNA helicase